MQVRQLIVAGLLFASIASAQTDGLVSQPAFTGTLPNAVITGNGTLSTDIAKPMWGTNMNAALQVSRNMTGDGGGQGSALDLYAGGDLGGDPYNIGGFVQRWFIDCATDGGKCVSMSFDYAGNFRLLGSMLASGIVLDHNSTGYAQLSVSPYDDGFNLGGWSDMAYGAAIVGAGNPYSNDGDANAQAFIALDGHAVDAGIGEYKPNVRFAIDGNSGKLRWTNSIANRYRDATWDATFGRVAAGVLGDQTTNLQTSHLIQPSGKNDIAGTISLVDAGSGSFSFGSSYAGAPVCTASPTSDPGAVSSWVTSTSSAVTVHVSAPATIVFNYTCVGNPL